MVDEYYMDGIDGIGTLEEDEENVEYEKISRQKKLIAIVKANPPLWDKRQKDYCRKNFNKELAWSSVAAQLGDISGSDAEKEFHKIRQKYGKERRKVIMSLKRKSGQSAQVTYIPTWELYEICDSFLRTVIIPRKTSSNYTKTASAPKPNEVSHLVGQYQLIMPENIKRYVAPHIIAQTPSAKLKPDCYASSSGDDTTDSTIFESPRIPLQAIQQSQVQFQSKILPATIVKNMPLKEEVNIRQQVLQEMSQSKVKIVPAPDTFKKKRRLDYDLTEMYMKQSEGLNNLAMQVSQTLLAKNTSESPHAVVPDPIVGAIHLALTKVKDTYKFECMLDVLQYINEKYVKNK